MFEANRYYTTEDDELTAIWSASTLANWRYERRGPAYIKTGRRILYAGEDLNKFLASRRVDPAA